MQFCQWLVYKGLSESSATKCDTAINGSITSWAEEAELISGPLSALTTQQQFMAIRNQILMIPKFIERNTFGHNMYQAALRKFEEYLGDTVQNDLQSDLKEIFSADSISVIEKINLVSTRIGKGKFRQQLIKYWKGCSITGYKDVNLLVASHIKPWSKSENKERLDMYNGLLLLPNLDVAFDSGFITFRPEGEILISPQLTEAEVLGIRSSMQIEVADGHKGYIKYHRENVFKASN
jgi:hypothetical protein